MFLYYYFFLSVLIFSFAVLVVVLDNPIQSLFSLICVFVAVSFLLLVLGFEFLALLLVIVYVGAIAVLFLFSIMLLNLRGVTTVQTPFGIPRRFVFCFVSFFVFLFLCLYLEAFFSSVPQAWITPNLVDTGYSAEFGSPFFWGQRGSADIVSIGLLLYTQYFVYFVLVGFILLFSMLGSILLLLT